MAAAQPSIVDLTTEQFDSIFKCNVYAMFWITRAAMPHLKPGAAIINTSSVEAYTPSDAFLDYAQTKACVVAFTKSLAKQVAEQGIRVNAVAPGPSGHRCKRRDGQISAGLATKPRLGVQASLPNWVLCMSSLRRRNQAT